MEFTTVLFYVFSAIMVAAGLRVITAKNPVHAALFLVLAFFNAAGIWMLLRAEFLAIVLVLVYVGAVMVLFLFVVMMLDLNIDNLRQGFWKHFPLAALIGVVIALEMAYVLMGGFREMPIAPQQAGLAQLSNTKALGILLYTEYLYPVQIAAVILVVAMIAAIALTLRQRKDSKFIDVSTQIHVKARDRLSVVKVDATRAAPPAPTEPSVAAPVEKKP